MGVAGRAWLLQNPPLPNSNEAECLAGKAFNRRTENRKEQSLSSMLLFFVTTQAKGTGPALMTSAVTLSLLIAFLSRAPHMYVILSSGPLLGKGLPETPCAR